ncbi:MAG TPA: hypothetical protein PKZ76_11895 [Xanthomonadaceae bacterium]|nr:hypothetical protein [Xanthomonadaceae bacterium]
MRSVFKDVVARLMDAEDELHYADPASLSAAQNASRARSIAAIGDAIADLVNQRLEDLTQAGQKALDGIDTATSKLAGDLNRAQTAADTVQVIAKALTTITRLVALVK